MPRDPRHDPSAPAPQGTDLVTLGRRVRHFRTAAGLTLDALGAAVGVAPSLLSMIENGRREPRLSLLQQVASALGVTVADLLADAAPSRRAGLEIELDRAQRGPLYATLGLPAVRASGRLPLPVLENLVGLHRELTRRATEAVATPEEARRANTELRLERQARDNYLPEIERLAERMTRAAGYGVGPLTHRTVARMAEQLGFTILHVDDLPHSTRTVTDLHHGRIYLPPASIPGGHGLRSLALQAIAHRVLDHRRPASYAEFLRQRVEITYFAACCLIPERAAVEFLGQRKKAKDLAVEDLRDAFGVTHEAAAQRFTNLATAHLGIPVHFLRVADDGALFRAYANDGLVLPADVTGAIEGQLVCRRWAAREALERRDRATESYQYTDTPAGTFWCSTQTGTTAGGEFSITVGVPFSSATWFRGRETRVRKVSTCPDEACCRRPEEVASTRWEGAAWPSARMHQQVLAALPRGAFPGVDDAEVYAFLERHAPEPGAPGRAG
ncbi:helix-turn-helix transcriptional regulator [Cellulomonas sp. PhB143]|uniref:helix-turn-helix transcriptional regulator n=1 Tax=Cellulomonas sp. PhB143 TaxID=2485186 RepID=UPI000F4A359B|nr:helix-turn-helix transcriptional regulator [Cellulomonas sp. PhB143]ROS76654.1 putative transcriptional regulator [Cellulomonas sp. PhB143]